MINIIVNEGHHIVGIALAVAVDVRGGGGGLGFVAAGQEHYEQHGGHCYGGKD